VVAYGRALDVVSSTVESSNAANPKFLLKDFIEVRGGHVGTIEARLVGEALFKAELDPVEDAVGGRGLRRSPWIRGRASDGLVLTARGFGNCRDRVHTAASGDATFRFLSLPAMVDAATVNESIVHGVAVAFPDGHRYQEYRRICGI
jgi:hypothetical protein